jgi:alpha-N-arabinofuranosidase
LRGPVSCGKYDSKEYSDVPWLETAAVHNQEKGELVVFAVNRNLTENLDLEADVHGFEKYRFAEHIVLRSDDLKAANSAGGERVKPSALSGGTYNSPRLEVSLPPASWNVIRLVK